MLKILTLLSVVMSANVYANSIEISTPWSKEVPPTSNVAAAFMKIVNQSPQPDILLAASSPIAKHVELHSHVDDNGVMKMRQVQQIDIKGDNSQLLAPGGYHVMLFDLQQVPKVESTFPLTLTFQQAGEITVDVAVKSGLYDPKNDHQDHHDTMEHHH